MTVTAALALLAGCNPQIQGNGVYAEERRNVGEFVGVDVAGGSADDKLSVVVTVDPAATTATVRVVTDANLIHDVRTDPYALTSTESVLRVYFDSGWNYSPTISPAVYVTVPAFRLVRATQSAAVEVKKAAAPAFTVWATGGATVKLGGTGGQTIDVTLAGASLYAAAYPVSGGASVELTGASDADLHSDGPVTGSVSGTSSLDNRAGLGDCGAVDRTGLDAAHGGEVLCNAAAP